jgi:hypothetical protein
MNLAKRVKQAPKQGSLYRSASEVTATESQEEGHNEIDTHDSPAARAATSQDLTAPTVLAMQPEYPRLHAGNSNHRSTTSHYG